MLKESQQESEQKNIHLSTASGKRGCRASCIKLFKNEMSCHVTQCLAY